MSSIVPQVNGRAYDWVGIKVKLLGVTIEGIRSIAYNTTQAKQNNYGAGTLPVSRSRGKKEHTASITLELKEYRRIVDAAGGDITNIPPFVITVTKNAGVENVTDILSFCEFTDQPQDNQVDNLNEVITLNILPGHIKYGAQL
jgi:hypothetical protein